MTDQQAGGDEEFYRVVASRLGLAFLSYLLNLSEETVGRCISGQEPLDSKRALVLQQLWLFVSRLPADGEDATEGPVWHFDLDELAMPQGDGPPWTTVVRMELGGDVEVPARRGNHRRLLAEIACDVYPLFLIPTTNWLIPAPFAPSLTRPLYGHRLVESFQESVLADGALRKLFPTPTDDTRQGAFVTRSTGTGSGISLRGFAEMMLKSGWRLAQLRETTPTLEQFIDATVEALDITQKAAAGKSVHVPVRVGLTGVVAEALPIDLPFGTLRPADAIDIHLTPPTLDGAIESTAPNGQTVSISYGGDLVLEMMVPYKIRIEGPEPEPITEWPSDLRGYEFIQTKLENVQLGLLLGGQGAAGPRVVPAWTSVFDPLNHGPSTSWMDKAQMPGFQPARLTRAQVRRWQKWIELVDERRAPSIDVAIRRTLRATSERRNGEDALLDAVIAWENLVGADEGETTLRITASLAWLVGRNAADRAAIEQQTRELYEVRSRLVHGSPRLTPREAGQRYEEALDLTISALRQLFEKRPDLLPLKSKNRSKQLLLGQRPSR